MTDITTIVAKLTEAPGQTAQELGVPTVEMIRYAERGMVIRLGKRKTGRRGAPPVEWGVPGLGHKQEDRVVEAIEEAQARVAAFRHYEVLSRAMLTAHDEFGYGSPEHIEAKLLRKETYPVPPEIPAKSDYAAVGAVIDDDLAPAA